MVMHNLDEGRVDQQIVMIPDLAYKNYFACFSLSGIEGD